MTASGPARRASAVTSSRHRMSSSLVHVAPRAYVDASVGAGGDDAVTGELRLPDDPPPEEAAAADHEKVHHGTLTQGRGSRPQNRWHAARNVRYSAVMLPAGLTRTASPRAGGRPGPRAGSLRARAGGRQGRNRGCLRPGLLLHSAYLYGSIPRGTAVPGVSDLDVLLALHGELGRTRPCRRPPPRGRAGHGLSPAQGGGDPPLQHRDAAQRPWSGMTSAGSMRARARRSPGRTWPPRCPATGPPHRRARRPTATSATCSPLAGQAPR